MIGRILGDRYEIIEQIGSGGMANVYLARCRRLQRSVAIKVLKPEYKSDQEFVRRFNSESLSAASLSHKNIVSIYDVGEQGDLHYIVMEYIEGKTLKEIINEKGSLYWKEALDFSMQICEALEHAHSKHIIHRDIKPQNIMVTNDGQIKVMDFGIARAASASTTKFENTALGSAHYISPEQARGGYTDVRTDIYSLGIVMYEMFTGKLPFTAESPIAVAMQHINKQPQSPASINPAIPSSIVSIIMRAMDKKQQFRYESAAQMYEDLKAVYIDPEVASPTETEEPDDEDAFATKKLKKIEDDWEEENIVPQVSPKRQQIKKQKRKEDRNAVTAAIITSAVLVVIAGFVMAYVLGFFGGAGNNTVPNLVGMELSEAKIQYPKYQIVQKETRYDDEKEENVILEQSPAANAKAAGVSVIEVVVSMGSETFKLDEYAGSPHMDAKIELGNLKLKVEEIEEESVLDEGVVIRQSPSAGSKVKKGDTITLYISSGKSETTTLVPSLLGMSVSQARNMLRQNNLELGNVSSVESEKDKDTIVSQNPGSNASVEQGASIDVVISAGKKATVTVTQVPEPNNTTNDE